MVETSNLLLAAGALGGAYYISRASGGGAQQPQLPQLPSPGGPAIDLDLSGLTPDAQGPAIDLGMGGIGEAFESQSNAIRTLVEERGGQQGPQVPWEELLNRDRPQVPWEELLNRDGPEPGPGPGGDGGPKRYGSLGEVLLNPGTWAGEQTENFPTVLGTDPSEFRQGEGLLGRSYQAGQITGQGINLGREAWADLDRQYREAVSGPREATQRAKDLTRPWRWDVPDVDLPGNLSPVGTAAGAPEPEPEPSISILDRSQKPGAGTPSPAEVEAIAAGAKEKLEEETEKVTQQAGSTGASFVR